MAYTTTGTYTDSVDLLSQFRTFILAVPGWSENLYADEGLGKRFHFERTDGTDTYYINLRAMLDEPVINNPWTTVKLTGLLVNEATGYDSGLNSMLQPGSPPPDTTVPRGGYIGTALTSGEAFRFTANTDYFTITIDGLNDIQQHIVVCASVNMYGNFCNGTFGRGSVVPESGGSFAPNRFLMLASAHMFYGCSLLLNQTSWKYMYESGAYGNSVRPMLIALESDQRGLVTRRVLDNSVNPNIGIPALFPFAVFHGTVTFLQQADGIDGIKVLNMKYIDNGQVITVGGKNYVVYEANSNLPDYGLAFEIP